MVDLAPFGMFPTRTANLKVKGFSVKGGSNICIECSPKFEDMVF
jgi:hypothetical protein